MWEDLRLAWRRLRRRPGFTAVAVLALALGIGANSALFSLVSQVLFSPLPFKEPQQLFMIWSTALHNQIDQSSVSGPDFLDWRQRNRLFADLTVMDLFCRFNLTGAGEPVVLKGARVGSGFLDLFGMPIALGRGFLPEEGQAGKENRLVLSYGLWQRRFGGAPDVVGRTVMINRQPYVVIGILGKTIGFLEDLVEAYAPLPEAELAQNRMNHHLLAFGRLKPGVSSTQAQADLAAISAALGEEYPSQKGWSVRLTGLQEELIKPVRSVFLVLYGAVVLVLLIACVNVANLLLAQAEGRGKEMAVRAAMGAHRWRLLRQLLTESMALGVMGAVMGLALAHCGIRMLVALSPRISGRRIPLFDEMGVDGRVLLFTLGLALVTSLLFGIAPAWRLARTSLAETLKEGGHTVSAGARRHRLLNSLVVTEVALSVILLVGAGLLLRNLQRLTRTDPGFDARNLLTMQMELPEVRYTNHLSRLAFYRQVIDRVKVLPGVLGVGLVNILPMDNFNSNWAIELEGQAPLPPGQFHSAEYRVVNHDYFQTMRVRLKQGRFFTAQDRGEGLPVLIINETLARRHFPNQDPLGRRIKVGGGTHTVVGVVGDEKFAGLGSPKAAMVYQPFYQDCWGLMSLVVRTQTDPMNLAGAVRTKVWAVDPDQPVTKTRAMTEVVGDSVAVQRFAASLLFGFAMVGLALASLGIYSVLAYVVSQRLHEIGVRMALGARVQDILRLVVGQGLALAGLGLAVGLALSLALARLLQSLLYEMRATDPLTFAGVLFLLLPVAALACYLPARTATNVQPMTALRYE